MKTVRQILWTQEWGTYDPATVVCCGFTDYKEIIEIMKADKCIQWARAIEARHPEDLKDLAATNHFTRWTMDQDGKEITYSILWLLDWKRDVDHYKILAHELIHAVSFMLGRNIDLIKENELFGYQHTFLFKQIADKLNECYYRKKKRNIGHRKA